MDMMQSARAIVDVLRAEHVRYMPGLPGGHVRGTHDALCGTPEITDPIRREG